jgi:hypothetical protein
MPIVHGGAIEEAEVKQAAAPPPPPAPGVAGGVIGGILPARKMEARAYRQQVGAESDRFAVASEMVDVRRDMASTVAATAVRAELGELFEYRIDHPVTIKAGESAMLPFYRANVQSRRLLIYDESNGSVHPLNAVEVTNSAGTTLDGGAITVYEANAYAGEALVETIKAGDKRLISYAVDLGTRITTAFDSTSKLLSEMHFRRGILTLRHSRLDTKTFTIHNVDKKAKTLILENPARPEFNLVGMKPAEKTAAAYRFEVPVAASETKKFPVTEEQIFTEDFAVASMTYDQLLFYVRNKELNEQGRQKLQQIADIKRQIADTERQIQRLEEQMQAIIQDQNRLRNNISTLRSVPGQDQKVQEYANTLAAQESEVVSIRDRQSELKQKLDELQRQVNDLIETMEF